jgi:hypothetical protein
VIFAIVITMRGAPCAGRFGGGGGPVALGAGGHRH